VAIGRSSRASLLVNRPAERDAFGVDRLVATAIAGIKDGGNG